MSESIFEPKKPSKSSTPKTSTNKGSITFTDILQKSFLANYLMTQKGLSEKKSLPIKNEGTGKKKNFLQIVSQIIFGNEGGYGSVNKDDNGSLSIGRIQWHATRAKDLLKKIVDKNPAKAKSFLEGTSLIEELNEDNEFWNKRVLNDTEAKALKSLLSSEEGIQIQNDVVNKDVQSYINHGKKLGITDEKTLAYFADLENQGGPGGSAKVVEEAGGGALLTLEKIHKAALENKKLGGKHKSRRIKTYEEIQKALGGNNSSISSNDVNLVKTESSSGEEDTKIKPKETVKSSEYLIHVVKSGETLGKIAKKYNTSIEEISKINSIVNIDKITAGQSLKIPNSKSSTNTLPTQLKTAVTQAQTSVEMTSNANHIPKTTPHNRRPGTPLNPTTLTIHSTDNPSSTAQNERNWLTNPINKKIASFHLVVDQTTSIECIPLDEVAYHAGTASGNSTSLSIEICESGDRKKTLENAIELTAKILKSKGWGVDKLRQHNDWSGKDCPRILRTQKKEEYQTWEWFKAEVAKKIGPQTDQSSKVATENKISSVQIADKNIKGNNANTNEVKNIETIQKTITTEVNSSSTSSASINWTASEKLKNKYPNQSVFIEKMLPFAVNIYKQTGIPWQFLMAQVCLESGYGKSEIKDVDSGDNSKNLFGIKYFGNLSDKSKYVRAWTKEEIKPTSLESWKKTNPELKVLNTNEKGNLVVRIIANFAKFDSYEAAFAKYKDTLLNANFKHAVRSNSNPVTYVKDLQSELEGEKHSKYATDSGYVQKISSVMKMWGFNEKQEIDLNKSVKTTKTTENKPKGNQSKQSTNKLSSGSKEDKKPIQQLTNSQSISISTDYSINSIVNNIKTLEELAVKFKQENGDSTSVTELVLRYIRRGGRYRNGNWPVVAGAINTDFNTYVTSKASNLNQYFNDNIMIKDTLTLEEIDFNHLIATLNVYVYDTGFGDFSGILDKVKALMPEANFDNLGGWAGDLQTLVLDVIKQTNNSEDYKVLYNKTMQLIGTKDKKLKSSFPMEDLLADTDAYNIYKKLSSSTLSNAIKEYYAGGNKSRYQEFTNNMSKSSIKSLTGIYTDENFAFLCKWPLYGSVEVSSIQSEAVRDAFTDYIYSKVEEEKTIKSTIKKSTKTLTSTKKEKVILVKKAENITSGYTTGSEQERMDYIFGKGSKVLDDYYKSNAEAIKHMKTIQVNIWKYNNATQKKESGTTNITINAKVADAVKQIFEDIYNDDEKFPISKSTTGGYCWRGDNSKSLHCQGLAIDINWDENAFMKNDGSIIVGKLYKPGENMYSIPKDSSVIKAFKKQGWYWGGEWKSIKDYMHFGYLNR